MVIKLVVGLFFGLQAGHLFAEEPGQNRKYLMGVGAPGSVPYNIGVGIGTVIKLVLMPKDGLDVSPVSAEGYHHNLKQIIDGHTQLAIVDSVSAQMARDGTGPFQNQGLGDQLTALATLWHDVDHFIVANEHARSGTISDLALLSSQELATNSTSHQVAREIMSRFGANIDIDDGAFWSEWETPLDAFDRGEIAGFAVTGPAPSSDVLYMLQQLDGRAHLLEFSRRQMAKIDDGWHAHSLAPEVYPGLATQIDTAARTVMLVAHAEASEEAIYQIVKTIFENLPYLRNMDEAATSISLDQAQQNLNLPLHPGAARYYQEAGPLLVGSDGPADPQSTQSDLHANLAGHGDNHQNTDQHSSLGKEALKEHIHDEAMLSRARAEFHDDKEVLKIGRPPVLRHPETEIFNVYFGLGETALADNDIAQMRKIVGRIMAFHESKGREPEVYVEGHTDSSGSWETNYEIAHRRARSVKEILISEGVPLSWIHISDYSEQGLAVPTADGVQEERNRRVEITIVPQG